MCFKTNSNVVRKCIQSENIWIFKKLYEASVKEGKGNRIYEKRATWTISLNHCFCTSQIYFSFNFNSSALACPKIVKPNIGTVLPSTCTDGTTFPGERCFLHCPTGKLTFNISMCSFIICHSLTRLQSNRKTCRSLQSDQFRMASKSWIAMHADQNTNGKIRVTVIPEKRWWLEKTPSQSCH